jgi:hypothetical protein
MKLDTNARAQERRRDWFNLKGYKNTRALAKDAVCVPRGDVV